MTGAREAAVVRTPLSRSRAAAALAAGLVTGGFAAWAYYDDLHRPLAHCFGLWIAMLALLSAGQRPRRAMVYGCGALAAAVLAFFVGKQVVYGIEYPGMPYPINMTQIVEWLALSVVAGGLLGWAFSWAGRPGLIGAVSTAAVIGLLVADAYRRSSNYPEDSSVVGTFAVLAVVVVLYVTVRSWRQAAVVVTCTIPFAVVGWLLVSAPDLLEQLLITGDF